MALDLSTPPGGSTPPPRRGPGRPKGSTSQAQTMKTKRAEREEGLNGLFQIAAAGCLMGGQAADGAAIAEHGPNIAREAATLADTNEKIGKVLDYLGSVGPFAGLLATTMPLVLQVLVNHKRLPMVPVLQQMGVKDPAALEAQAKAAAMRQAIQAQREQQAAEQEFQEMVAQVQAQEYARQNGRPTPTDVPRPSPR